MKKSKTLKWLVYLLLFTFMIINGCKMDDKKLDTEKSTIQKEKPSETDVLSKVYLYICPMHPLERSNEEKARCSICRMHLEPKQDFDKKMNQEVEAMKINLKGVYYVIDMAPVKCDDCKPIIEKALRKNDGISGFFVDIYNFKIHLFYNKMKTSAENVEQLLIAEGFDTKDHKASEESKKNLPECCR